MLESLDVKNPGVWIWRVDSFRLVEIPKPSQGTFFTGDSYVVLHTYQTKNGIKHRIYAWQGRDSSPDEKASSAILAKKLDEEELGGVAEQVREVQHEETDDFRKLFAGGLNFKAGGVPSGFRHAAQAASKQDEAHLFAVISPTRTSIQVVEVEPRLSSMRSNASFVLDAPGRKTLFVWHGDGANLREKSKSLEVANTFRSNRGSLRLTVLDQADTDSDDARAFFQLLHEANPEEAAKSIGPSDQPPPCISAAAATPNGGGSLGAPRLFRLLEGGAPQEVPGPPSRSSLSADAQFGLVVNGRVFVWSGSKAPPATREQGMSLARAAGLSPEAVPVELTKENLEPGSFMVHFSDWNDAQFARFQAYQASKALPDSYGSVSSPKHHKSHPHGMQFDKDEVAKQMVHDAQTALQSAPHPSVARPSSGMGTDGQLTVWVVRSSVLVELPQNERGHFFDGDAYVILFEYTLNGEARQMIYFWVGRHSSNHEKGAAALLATDMYNDKYRGTSALCRVAQNSEPAHFAAVFGGSLIIHAGERPAQGGCLPGGARLYKVKAETAQSVHAVEVELKASSLTSGDCFVLKEPSVSEGGGQGRILLWQGSMGSEEEIEIASRVAQTLADASAGASVVRVKEGEEPSDFWSLLGGRAEYPHGSKAATHRTPLLLHIRDTAGPNGVKVEVSATFNQDSLAATDAMILDPGTTAGELYVWCGRDASELERPRAHMLAEAYARAQGQQQYTVVDVNDGAEPPFFTQHFVAWDPMRRSCIPDVYQEKLRKQQQERERAEAEK